MLNSHIQWTDNTWNPFTGCKKVSQGCKFCYMYRWKDRFKQDAKMIKKSKIKFYEPLKWHEPKKVFVCSLSDFFIEEADQWRPELWEIIKQQEHLTFQILTKRPERIKECLPEDWGDGYPNVWLGVSVENQDALDRIDILKTISANIRFLSYEPLIGKIKDHSLLGIDWVIIGGESGNENGKHRYRECKVDWLLKLVQNAQKQDAPVFVKQLGTYLAKSFDLKDRSGGDMTEWDSIFLKPLQVREFPINSMDQGSKLYTEEDLAQERSKGYWDGYRTHSTHKIITLCGSTKFKDAFTEANKRLTMEGNIVLSVGVFGHADGIELTEKQKVELDAIHKAKIALSTEIYVLNVGGYIGKSTQSEIEYAESREKVIKYLEEPIQKEKYVSKRAN